MWLEFLLHVWVGPLAGRSVACLNIHCQSPNRYWREQSLACSIHIDHGLIKCIRYMNRIKSCSYYLHSKPGKHSWIPCNQDLWHFLHVGPFIYNLMSNNGSHVKFDLICRWPLLWKSCEWILSWFIQQMEGKCLVIFYYKSLIVFIKQGKCYTAMIQNTNWSICQPGGVKSSALRFVISITSNLI